LEREGNTAGKEYEDRTAMDDVSGVRIQDALGLRLYCSWCDRVSKHVRESGI
jgi:hypothetical protein